MATDTVTSRRSRGTHSRGEGAYRSSCDGRCCWLGEYIHSGSYLILTLTTWVHPFWLISYTYTDDVSTSILAHILYLHWRREYIHSGSCFILLHITYTVCLMCLFNVGICVRHMMGCILLHYLNSICVSRSLCHVSVWWGICVRHMMGCVCLFK